MGVGGDAGAVLRHVQDPFGAFRQALPLAAFPLKTQRGAVDDAVKEGGTALGRQSLPLRRKRCAFVVTEPGGGLGEIAASAGHLEALARCPADAQHRLGLCPRARIAEAHAQRQMVPPDGDPQGFVVLVGDQSLGARDPPLVDLARVLAPAGHGERGHAAGGQRASFGGRCRRSTARAASSRR